MNISTSLGIWNNNINNNISIVENEDSLYYVTPPIPDVVFTISVLFLVVTGTFGILANLSIFGLFFTTPAVSIQPVIQSTTASFTDLDRC